jgi:hypothetical protein
LGWGKKHTRCWGLIGSGGRGWSSGSIVGARDCAWKKWGTDFYGLLGDHKSEVFYYRNEWTRILGRRKAERTNVACGRTLWRKAHGCFLQ